MRRPEGLFGGPPVSPQSSLSSCYGDFTFVVSRSPDLLNFEEIRRLVGMGMVHLPLCKVDGVHFYTHVAPLTSTCCSLLFSATRRT